MSQPAPTLPPDQAVATLLLEGVTAGGVTLVYGENLYTGPVRIMTDERGEVNDSMPTQAVFVLLSGGDAPDNAHDNVLRTANLHVWVRGLARAFDDGQVLARALWRVINRQLVDNYIGVECNESEPRYSGPDDNDNHMWMIAVRMQYWD